MPPSTTSTEQLDDSPGRVSPLRARAEGAGRGTHGVAEVRRLVEDQFHLAFPHRVWLVGEVAEVAALDDGGLAFELRAVDADGEALRLPAVLPGDLLPQVGEVLDRVNDAVVDDLVLDGRLLRAGGLLRYDFPQHRLQLTVSALDAETTAAALDVERAEVLERVLAEGLPERQRLLAAPVAPTRIGVVGPRDSSAVAAVTEGLRGSGYAFDVRIVPVDLQGRGGAARLAAAVSGVDTDLVLLVREEGRPLALAPYDDEAVARAVATSPVPVVTGIGRPSDVTVADRVAAMAAPTPAAAADHVVARLAAAEGRLRSLRDAVITSATHGLSRASTALAAARTEVEEAADEAALRADAAAARSWRTVLLGAAAVAVLLVVVAALTDAWLLLLALPLLAAAVAGERWRRSRYSSRPRRALVSSDVSFAAVLDRLARIRDELAMTSSPERVHELSDEAEQLIAHGESVLGRPLPAAAAPSPEGRTVRAAAPR